MSKNVSNDVSKDPPIPSTYADMWCSVNFIAEEFCQ